MTHRHPRPRPWLRAGLLISASLAAFAWVIASPALRAEQQGRVAPTRDNPRPPIERRAPVVQTSPAVAPTAAPLAYRPMSAARAAAFVQAADRKLGYLPGEVLVKFRSGVTTAGQQRALQSVRSQPLVSDLRWIDQVALLHDDTQPDAHVLAAQLSAQPEVEFAEPNYLYRYKAVTPNDPGFSARQWNFTAIGMPDAWTISPGGTASVIVAVVDTGITTVPSQNFTFSTWNGSSIQSVSLLFKSNPDLSVSRLVSPWDFVTGMNGVVLDTDGHGTHVSATIGEDTNNGIAEAGMAYNVRIMPVKVCTSYWDVQFAWSAAGHTGFVPSDSGACPDDAIGSGIRYAADNGAKVINISLAGPGTASVLQSALIYAVGKGAFIAMAAGNEFEQGNPVEYPAAYGPSIEGAMAVGAVGKSLKRAYYSNTGSYVEIVAPGGDGRDAGSAGYIYQSTLIPNDSDPTLITLPRFDRYAEIGYEGTSMATPHVSGLAALLVSRGVTNPGSIEALIRASAKDLGTAGKDNEYGYGLIQARDALFGKGIVK
jgi:serine protease